MPISHDNSAEGEDLLQDWLAEHGDDGVIYFPEYDRAIIGLAEGMNEGPFLIYDKDTVIEILMEDGLEHFYYNIAGAYVGERTPMFLTKRFR